MTMTARFSATLTGNWIELERLIDNLRVKNSPAELDLLDAARSWLVAHLRGARCSVTPFDAKTIVDRESAVLTAINDRLSARRMVPISRTEIPGSHTAPSRAFAELWRSPRSEELDELISGLDATSRTTNSRQDTATRAEWVRAADAVAGWRLETARSEALYFHERFILWSRLAALPGPMRQRAQMETVATVEAAFPYLSHAEWFGRLAALLAGTPVDSPQRRESAALCQPGARRLR